jgi:phosphoglycerol transferase
MEDALPPGGMVFQLPAVSYPEAGTTHRMPDYAHLACHSYSRTLRWSYGTNRNRRWDEWHQYVASLPSAEFVRALVLADFAGVYVDRRGYADRGDGILTELRGLLGPEVAASDSGEQLLFALAPAAQPLRSATDPVAWERDRERLMSRPCVLCQDGFLRWSPTNPPEPWRATHTAMIRLINPGERTRRVTLRMDWQRQITGDNEVTVTGPRLSVDRRFALPTERAPFALDVDLPPGEHVLRFETTPKPLGLARMYTAWDATGVRLIERD